MKKLLKAFIAALVLVGTASAGSIDLSGDAPAGGNQTDGRIRMWSG